MFPLQPSLPFLPNLTMKSIVLAFAALFGAASASVEILGQDNFDTAIASGNDYFVKLYAPW